MEIRGCPLPIDWLDYVSGDGDPVLREHLSSCASCRAVVAAIQGSAAEEWRPGWRDLHLEEAPRWSEEKRSFASFGDIWLTASSYANDPLRYEGLDRLLVVVVSEPEHDQGWSWVDVVPLTTSTGSPTELDFVLYDHETSLAVTVEVKGRYPTKLDFSQLDSWIGALTDEGRAVVQAAQRGEADAARFGTPFEGPDDERLWADKPLAGTIDLLSGLYLAWLDGAAEAPIAEHHVGKLIELPEPRSREAAEEEFVYQLAARSLELVELDRELERFWEEDGADDAARRLIEAALERPPTSTFVAAHYLQLMELFARDDERTKTFAGHVEGLREWLHRVDDLGSPDVAVAEAIAAISDVGQLSLEHIDLDALRDERALLRSRADAARATIERLAVDWESVDERLRSGLDELEARSRFSAHCLFSHARHPTGFVLGVSVVPSERIGVHARDEVGSVMRKQAERALSPLFPEGGVEWDLEWSLKFDGHSLGLALYVAGLAARGHVQIDPLVAATGSLGSGDEIEPVGGIREKAHAAWLAGVRRLLLPAENEPELRDWRPTSGPKLVYVSHISEVRAALEQALAPTESDYARRIRVIRNLIPFFALALEGEETGQNYRRFHVMNAEGLAMITAYTGPKGTVRVEGKPSSAKEAAERLVASIASMEPERRPRLSFKLPREREQRLVEALKRSEGEHLDPRPHERWRYRLARGRSRANLVLFNTGTLVLEEGQAPAHDELRALAEAALEGLRVHQEAPTTARVLPAHLSLEEPHFGTDESGKGDYFGPLVSAAVWVDASVAATLEQLGVKDSKKLSDKRVRVMARELRRVLAGRYAITPIGPKRFNELYRDMRREGKSLNTLLAWGHARSIEDLIQKGIRARYVIVDQFADARYMQQKILADTRESGLEVVQFPKAESYIAVAAASVLARDEFLHWLERHSAQLGLHLPKGASPQVVEAARELVARHGSDRLGEFVKLSFKTTEKVLE
jgi:ribonuclease HIII